MRKKMTPQEGVLWHTYLKKYPIKIFRQKIIGNYIADFYCSHAKLIIELDGSQHFEENSIEYDKIRTDYFNSLGIKVIRFTNNEIKQNIDSVCMMIDKEIKHRA